MNSTLLQYQCVPTFSKYVVVLGVRFRCALIGYSRRSVDDSLVTSGVHGPYVDFVCNEYSKFVDERKFLSPSLFTSGVPIECIPKLLMLKNPCNLDPWGHYSSIIEATLLLDRKFKLSLPERLSLLRAMAVAPNSSYLYAAASTVLLQLGKLNPRHRKQYRFGLLVANLMNDIHQKLANGRRKCPPRRFNCYRKYVVPDEEDWNEECDRLLLLHLTTPDIKKKADRQAAYKEVRRALADIFPNVDVLGGNHLVAIAGTLGLLPLWVTTEIEIQPGRSTKWLMTRFYADETERGSIKLEDVVLNLVAALTTRNGGTFSRRKVENIICKVFRRNNRNISDGSFFDVLFPEQNLYSVEQNFIRVMTANGKKSYKGKQPLLDMVPFRGKYITTKELRTHLPASWPGWDPKVKELGRTFRDGIFDSRRAEYPVLPFDLNFPFDQGDSSRNKWLHQLYVSTDTRMLK